MGRPRMAGAAPLSKTLTAKKPTVWNIPPRERCSLRSPITSWRARPKWPRRRAVVEYFDPGPCRARRFEVFSSCRLQRDDVVEVDAVSLLSILSVRTVAVQSRRGPAAKSRRIAVRLLATLGTAPTLRASS
jgi:hypothetical protein